MGKNSQVVAKIQNEALKERFDEIRASVEDHRLPLGFTAIKQRLEQDKLVALAAYEIDQMIENSRFRIQPRPEDAYPEICAIQARIDACEALMEIYRPAVEAEQQRLEDEMKAQMEARIAEAEEAGWEFGEKNEESILEIEAADEAGDE